MGKPSIPVTLATIRLPWPQRALWQNSRVHWSKRAKATAVARQDAFFAALDAGLKQMPTGEGWGHLISFDFCPPDRRKRDLQNMPATMKPAIDGIADALKVDDASFTVIWPDSFNFEYQFPGSVLVEVLARRASLGEG